MTRELDDDLHSKIVLLCKEGDELQRKSHHQEALRKYESAWNLLPEPKEDWEAATWILATMGDTYWSIQDYSKTVSVLTLALKCPSGLGNPFIHLRLGEAYFELSDSFGKRNHLTRAYIGAGREIFKDEDPKYLEFLKDILLPPVGKDEL